MSYAETRPPLALAPWVSSWWCFSVEPDAGDIEHRIPLTGGTMLSVGPDGEAILAGPRVEPLVTTVRGGETYRGVHFRPGAASSLLGAHVSLLKDAVGPARFLLDGTLADSIQAGGSDETFESWSSVFLSRASTAPPPHPTVQLAVALIAHAQGTAPVASIAAEVNCSPRALRRLFTEHVGLTPKELSRVIRLRSAAAGAVARGESWLDLAAQGFSDQPHLVREFRSILGVSPSEFEQHAKRIAHTLV